MSDMAPMDPCPCGKNGAHELSAVLPESSDGDLTLFCDRCGALRRVPVQGAIYADRLDDVMTEVTMMLPRSETR